MNELLVVSIYCLYIAIFFTQQCLNYSSINSLLVTLMLLLRIKDFYGNTEYYVIFLQR